MFSQNIRAILIPMDSRNNTYRSEVNTRNREKLSRLQQELPRYAVDYLLAIRAHCELSTVVSYGEDLMIFFEYLRRENPLLKDTKVRDIPLEMIASLNFHDINAFISEMSYTTKGTVKGREIVHDAGRSRKRRMLSSLNAMFNYLRVHEYIEKNPAEGAEKIRMKDDKEIIRLSTDEAEQLMDSVKRQTVTVSSRRRKYDQKTVLRDTAICTLLLNTGMRVSECTGIDLKDIDFDERCIWIIRKGGQPDRVYFNDRTSQALTDYLQFERPHYVPAGDSTDHDALFLSMQKKRMSTRAIQYMIHNYGESVLSRSGLSPHKLRKTYGTELYNRTGDIKLVADILGHQNMNTTKKYYIASDHKKYGRDQDLFQ